MMDAVPGLRSLCDSSRSPFDRCGRIHAMYEFTPADPTIKRPSHETRLTGKRKILLIYIPLVAFASMMAGVVIGQNQQTAGLVQLLLGIVINVLALLWVKIDADERH